MTKKYSPISVRAEVAERFRSLAQGIGQENTEALQICMVAYDVINSTNYGGRFTDAVNRAFKEAASVE